MGTNLILARLLTDGSARQPQKIILYFLSSDMTFRYNKDCVKKDIVMLI